MIFLTRFLHYIMILSGNKINDDGLKSSIFGKVGVWKRAGCKIMAGA